MTSASLAHPHVHVVPKPRLDRWGRLTVTFLGLLGLGALGGGAMLISSPDGSAMQWTVAMLDGSPFTDFAIPGIIMGGLFGVGSFAVVALGLARVRLAPFLAFAVGCAQMIWIAVELAIIGEFSFLHPTMFGIGLLIAAFAVPWGLPTLRAWRRG
jgi:hypothetical protein